MNWSALLSATIQMYRQAATDTRQRLLRNWWVGLLPFLYGAILFLVALFVFPLGMVGGFIFGFISALCTSSYLYFIAGIVNGQRMLLSELGESWRPYLSPVITVLFFFFLVQLTLQFTSPSRETSPAIAVLVALILLVLLNPLPEIVYLGRSDGFGMLQESFDFLRENWLEWFLPLVLFTILSFEIPLPLFSPLQVGHLGFSFMSMVSLLFGSIENLLWSVISAFILLVLMVFRGLLFRGLFGSSRRQRLFRSRLQ